jgi:hypothetical protein
MSSKPFFVFDPESALKADGAGIIDKGGNYLVTLKDCYVGKTQNGATYLEINGECATGEKLNYLTIYTKGTDGKATYGVNKINALCGILGISQLSYIAAKKKDYTGKEVDAFKVVELENKVLYIGVYREDQKDQNGQYRFSDKGQLKFKMELSHFFHPKTMQTYTEMVEKKEPATFARPVYDKLAPAGTKPNQGGQQPNSGFGGGFGGGFEGGFGGANFGNSGFAAGGANIAPFSNTEDDLLPF